MAEQKAVDAFTKERLNCAQSVIKAFGGICQIDENMIVEAKAYGGGRAEEGLCGALYAALLLLEDEGQAAALREDFASEAGSQKCREIKSGGGLPCADCVRLAARLLARAQERRNDCPAQA